MTKTKKYFKIFLAAVFCLVAAFAFASCDWKLTNPVIKVYMPDGAPLLSLAKLRSDDSQIVKRFDAEYYTVADPDTLTSALIKGEPDIALAPINVCAMVYNKGGGYLLAGVSVWGIMHIVSNQPGDVTLESLIGGTVLAFGRSETPGITFREILTQNGIPYVEDGTDTPGKVNILYMNGAGDVRNVLASTGTVDGRQIKYALLAEPVATAIADATAGKEWGPYRAVINLQTEWAKRNDGVFPQVGLIFKEKLLHTSMDFFFQFIEGQTGEEFVKGFIDAASASTAWAAENPYAAGELAKNSLGSAQIPGGAVVEKAVTEGRLPLNFVGGADAKGAVEAYLTVILNAKPTLIGEKLPSDGFYYAR
ncbi:MAG: hypothetical protein LBP79_01080 [Clostridiales bacterium]|jgi:NitT/TauT family transport system substrate-binding protein|nr:hypothetical protein [Clostridiales bacterium]